MYDAWKLHKISFIYYFSYCNLIKSNKADSRNTNKISNETKQSPDKARMANKSDESDKAAEKANKSINRPSITTITLYQTVAQLLQPPEDNNYCTIINLHFYQPFVEAKSNVRGHLERIDFINDCTANSKLPNNSKNIKNISDSENNELFTQFPFKNDHKLNLNGISLTVILFPSTMAYLREELPMLKKYLSKDALKFPFGSSESYFGEDPETIQQLSVQMNFSVNLTRSSDLMAFGFKVRFQQSHTTILHNHFITKTNVLLMTIC